MAVGYRTIEEVHPVRVSRQGKALPKEATQARAIVKVTYRKEAENYV